MARKVRKTRRVSASKVRRVPAFELLEARRPMDASLPSLLSVVPATPAIGPAVCRSGYAAPQGTALPFDTTGDLAYQGNGSARPAVARDTIPGYAGIHQAGYANDGKYGNGTSLPIRWSVADSVPERCGCWAD